jgi:predicted RND superfamily exporter protein
MEKLLKHPALVVGAILVITLFLGLQLPRMELDNNNVRFLPDENRAKITSEYIDETFGGQVMILVGLERPYRTVFEKGFLSRIREFAQAVEDVELVKTVNSIMSTQYITGDSESIIVSDLVPEDFSGKPEEIAELRRRIASWDLFQSSLVSDDLSATQVLVTLDVLTENSSSPEVSLSLAKIRKLAGEIFPDEAVVYFAGQPVINATINESIVTDNLLLIPLVIIVVLGLLILSFRRFLFVILPLLSVIIAVVWTVGIAVLLGIKLTTLTTMLPVILVAVGNAYGIHIITHYVKDTRNKTLTVLEHQLLVFGLMKKMEKPISLAALTTIIGFLSFCFTPIVPMREFGYCASAGVLAIYILTVLFIPSMLLLRGYRNIQSKKSEEIGTDRISNTIANIFLSIAQRKFLVLIFAVLIVIVSIYGISKIVIDNSVVDFFQNETDISRSDRFIRKYFGGSKDITLVVRSDTTEELLHPDVLRSMDGLSTYLTTQIPAVGKVSGFTDIIKRINQVFNVDQNPGGIQPFITYAETDNFGFDDNFAFGGLCFGDDDIMETPGHKNDHDLAQYNTADLLNFLDTAAGISRNMSGSDLVKELKRLTNYDGMAYYEIPTNPTRYGKETPEELQRLIANYLVLLAGGDDSGYSNDPLEPTAIRMMIQLRTTGNKDTHAVIDIINDYVAVNFPKNVDVILGGGVTQEMAVTNLILNSQIISIFISVIMIFLIVGLFNKSLVAGLIGAVPLILAVLCNFTVMGFLGIKLNLGTALIASLTVCIGIDDAIHFIEFFKREYRRGEQDFLRRTFMDCGRAICTTAVSVGAGFGVLAFSQFKITAELGMLVAFCMLLTTLISLTVIPALLMVIKPRFIYKEDNS